MLELNKIYNVNNNFILHKHNSNWGWEILIMEKNGRAFARVYWWNDNENDVYLDWLNVDIEMRRRGIGTELQQIRENIGRKIGAKNAYLTVTKDAWMHEWYKRRGYKDYQDKEDDENSVWMYKSLL